MLTTQMLVVTDEIACVTMSVKRVIWKGQLVSPENTYWNLFAVKGTWKHPTSCMWQLYSIGCHWSEEKEDYKCELNKSDQNVHCLVLSSKKILSG